MTYVRQRAPSATWTAFLSSFRFQVKRPEHAPRLPDGTRSTPQRNHKDGAGRGPRDGPARGRFPSNSSFRRKRPDHLSREASGTPQPQNNRRRDQARGGGFTKYILFRPPAFSAGRRYFPTARQPRQLITHEAASHGTIRSRRTPPRARGGFAAPAGQLNARQQGSPKNSSAGS